MVLKYSELLLTIQKDIKSIITIKHKVESIYWTGGDMLFSYLTHPNVTEVTCVTSPHSHTTPRQVELFFKLDTVAPQADPETLHHSTYFSPMLNLEGETMLLLDIFLEKLP